VAVLDVGGGRAPAERRTVDDVVHDERGVVDEFDPDREVDGRPRGVTLQSRVPPGGLARQDRHRRPDALAPGQRDVPHLLGQRRRLHAVEDRLETVLDAGPSALEVLHRLYTGSVRASR